MKTVIALASLLLLVGCVSSGPELDSDFFESARSAVDAAVAAGADQHAPLELRFAREKLAAAEQANVDGEADQARRLARQAEVDAELCVAKTQAAIARDAARQQREANERLQVELEAVE